MKKVITIIAVAFLVASYSNVKAQTFENGSMVANVGLGFGWYGYDYNGISSTPFINVSLEKGIKDIPSINSVLSIGGIAGYKHGSWSGYGYNGSYNDIIIAARGALHSDIFKVEKLDTYAGVTLGLRIHNEDYPYTSYDNDFTNPLFGIYAGARYYFTNNLAGFGEIGAGTGYLTLGLSLKIK
jgi:hypothetical protein